MKRTLTLLFPLILTCLIPTLPTMAQTAEMEQDLFDGLREGDKAVVVAIHDGTLDGSAISTSTSNSDKPTPTMPSARHGHREAP